MTSQKPALLPSFLIAAFLTLSPIYNEAAAEETAEEKLEIRNYGLITAPACVTPEGVTIGIYPGTPEQIVSFGGFLAAAGDFEVGINGGIINEDRIYYDQINMPFIHPLLQEFLFHHECAHITLNHLEIPPIRRQGMYFPLEQAADCVALEKIQEESDNFERDAETVLANFAFIAERIMPAAPGREAIRTRFIEQRIENMRACPVFE